MRVYVHNSYFWARGNPRDALEYGYRARVWAGIVGDLVVGPCLLPNDIMIFSGWGICSVLVECDIQEHGLGVEGR
jgi:hypothetical protein